MVIIYHSNNKSGVLKVKKITILSILLILAVVLTPIAQAADLIVTSPSNPSGNPGATVTVTFSARTTGSVPKPVTFSSSTLTKGADTITVPGTFTDTLNDNNIKTLSFQVTIPAGKAAGTYSGTITIKETGNDANSATLPYSVTVNSITALDVQTYTTTNPLTVNVDKGESTSSSFTVQNTGTNALTLDANSFTYDVTKFTDSNGKILTLSFVPLKSSLAAGEQTTVTVSINAPSGIEIGNYLGTIIAKSGTAQDTFAIEAKVQPSICSDGVRGRVTVDIKDPDNGDDFKPGDTIQVTAKVDNDIGDDSDFVITAVLYDISDDNEVESVDSDSVSIDDGDNEDIDVDLEVPYSDIKKGSSYKLFVKAYEDGEEDTNCALDSIDLDLKLEKHEVQIDKFTLAPIQVSCSDTVTAVIGLQNIGSNDEDDVYVSLVNSLLGLNEQSTTFDLDKLGGSDDTSTERISFQVPNDAKDQQYQITATVYYNDGKDSRDKTQTLTVKGCSPTTGKIYEVSTPSSLSVDSGDTLSLPVSITNNGDEKVTLTVSAVSSDGSLSSDSKTVVLDPGKSTTVNLALDAKEGISGTKTLTLTTKSGNTVVDTKNLNVNIRSAAPPVTGGTTGTGKVDQKTIFWIIGDIVLIIVGLFFIKLIFSRRKKDKDELD